MRSPPFQPRPAPHRRKHAEPVASAGPAELEVLRVQWETDNSCIWVFSRTIADGGDPSGFIAGFDISAAINWIAGNRMSLFYADAIAPGDPWTVDPSNLTTTFDPPGTLEPQGGVIT